VKIFNKIKMNKRYGQLLFLFREGEEDKKMEYITNILKKLCEITNDDIYTTIREDRYFEIYYIYFAHQQLEKIKQIDEQNLMQNNKIGKKTFEMVVRNELFRYRRNDFLIELDSTLYTIKNYVLKKEIILTNLPL
jgi:hypothetical protein